MRTVSVVLLLCGIAVSQRKYELVAPQPIPRIDVPAKDEPAYSDGYMSGETFGCTNGGKLIHSKDGFPVVNMGIPQCKDGHALGCKFDPDRILIGPDGHGKYWCHLPQP